MYERAFLDDIFSAKRSSIILSGPHSFFKFLNDYCLFCYYCFKIVNFVFVSSSDAPLDSIDRFPPSMNRVLHLENAPWVMLCLWHNSDILMYVSKNSNTIRILFFCSKSLTPHCIVTSLLSKIRFHLSDLNLTGSGPSMKPVIGQRNSRLQLKSDKGAENLSVMLNSFIKDPIVF